jgi:hypothetical protein
MFKSIPLQRLILYVMVIGLLPFFFVLVSIFSKIENLQELENAILHVQTLALTRERRQAVNIAVESHFRDADHFYIDKYIETIPLLEPEVESLQKLINNPSFTEDEGIKKRLEFLTGTGNTLTFSEGVVQSTPLFQEVIETLVHPVEVNASDLQNILAKIEGIPIGTFAPAPGRPQLIILDFKLDKKVVSEKNEVYQLNLKLLKREFL